MSQHTYGPDPINKKSIVYYLNDGKWSIARMNDGGYDYMTAGFIWEKRYSANTGNYPSAEVAKAVIESYCIWCLHPDQAVSHPPAHTILFPTCTPHGIDRSRMRIRFRCPSCSGVHVSELKTPDWKSVAETVVRNCPKTPTEYFRIKMWNKKPLFVSAPQTDILKLPKYDCPSCFGSGEYLGFHHISDCEVCLPKNQ